MRIVLLLALVAARPLHAQCADGSPPPCPASPARAPGSLSIAVLPFGSRSPDTTEVYFAEAMTDEIANQLARVGKLQVRARSAVAAQWRRTPDALESARRLNVAWLVHGHVRRAGPQLLVNVELVRAATGEEAWATRFRGRTDDLFAVQAEIAESVTVAVGGRLSPRERAVLVRRPTRSNEAYRLYLYGNSQTTRRTAESLRRAIDAYEGAIRADSTFALAWARLAVAAMLRVNYDATAQREASIRVARTAIRRAMALDSTSSDVHLADGMLAIQTNVASARARFERAVQLDTLNEEAVGYLGYYYLWYPLDSARAEPLIRRAIALNPDRKISWLHLNHLYWYLGHAAKAEAYLDTVQALGPWPPAFVRRANMRFCEGDGEAALRLLGQAERSGRMASPEAVALVRMAAGDTVLARQRLAYWRAVADTAAPPLNATAHWNVAQIHLVLRRHDDAMAALERVEPDINTWRELHSPCLAPLRKDPRFTAVLERARAAVP